MGDVWVVMGGWVMCEWVMCKLLSSGCYDGCVYALCADSGEVHSCYHISQDPIKSSPCVDPTTGLVWVGSHDQHIYAISLQVSESHYTIPWQSRVLHFYLL